VQALADQVEVAAMGADCRLGGKGNVLSLENGAPPPRGNMPAQLKIEDAGDVDYAGSSFQPGVAFTPAKGGVNLEMQSMQNASQPLLNS